MASTTHTDGPWFVVTYPNSDVVNIRGDADFPVSQMGWMPEGGRDVTMANAHLIAAAPELLEALVELDRVYEVGDFETEFRPALDRARAAIAKATGGAA